MDGCFSGTHEVLEKGNEVLRVMSHQFKAKCEKPRASLGDEKVKLRIKTKTRTYTRESRAPEKVQFSTRQVYYGKVSGTLKYMMESMGLML